MWRPIARSPVSVNMFTEIESQPCFQVPSGALFHCHAGEPENESNLSPAVLLHDISNLLRSSNDAFVATFFGGSDKLVLEFRVRVRIRVRVIRSGLGLGL